VLDYMKWIEALDCWDHNNWDSNSYPNFSFTELVCKETGENRMTRSFLARLQRLRWAIGKPLLITSGYRSVKSSIEAAKIDQGKLPGTHAFGSACDISCHGALAHTLLKAAIDLGFTGIGVSQSGGYPFIHLDDLDGDLAEAKSVMRPTVWSY